MTPYARRRRVSVLTRCYMTAIFLHIAATCGGFFVAASVGHIGAWAIINAAETPLVAFNLMQLRHALSPHV